METPINILVVEDEAHLAQGLFFNLQADGFAVTIAGDGESALEILHSESQIDAVLLDVMLPGKSGFDVAKELRDAQNYVPIMMLTARGRPEDVLCGFAAGADDYLAKPFDLSILLARLNSLLRRMAWHRTGAVAPVSEKTPSAETEAAVFCFADRSIDFSTLELTAMGRTVRLTLMEADLLRYLSKNPERIISRKELLEQVWRVHEDTDTRAIDNFIVRLRRYIEDEPSEPIYLQTVRGIGYRFLPSAVPAQK